MTTDTKTIPNGWKETTLFDVATWINGLAFREIDFSKQGVPVIKISELKNGVTEQTGRTNADFDPKYRLKKRDMLFSWSGSPETSIDVFWYGLNDGWLNQHIFKVLPKDVVESDFLYYILKNYKDIFIHRAKQKQTTGLGHVTVGDLKVLTCFLPPLPEQRAIAAVLSSLDDKIELLREENKTLEAIAQTMFKEWFVNFNFPNADRKPYKTSGGKMADSELGEIPEGWRVSGLTGIAHFLNGLALQNFPPESKTEYLPVIKIKELGTGITEQTDKASAKLDKKYVVEDGDILFSWSGSLIVDIWKYGKGVLNQHLFKVTSEEFPKWFYFHWIKEHLPSFQQTATAKAVTMGHIQRHHLDDALVAIPDSDFMKTADSVFYPMFEKFMKNNAEIQTLSASRDALLPKLMKGEIRVS